MQVTLDMTDAMELVEQLLEFLAGWMKADRDYLAPRRHPAAVDTGSTADQPSRANSACLRPRR